MFLELQQCLYLRLENSQQKPQTESIYLVAQLLLLNIGHDSFLLQTVYIPQLVFHSLRVSVSLLSELL